ncbi:LysR family transcriptional regulator [Xenorhabdus nematophila]|uniref:HTH lysR-type domain-containing protein n=1 Tax=Xenorhabdus nematophila (strain ATCC 19061 / DSM 3370 / CCUG 14189 / LMG 1036 / NCIMB 9965 / AN6) TaxID=406817 RepID=D3VGG5_XENNA|nr:LysR family transcriptional regulator [Xenorhabdus nematophila]CEE89975.1 hypothetical protein XNA1_1060009 [Xenorhabdus nematophila str. Anatoliense]CBJ90401.1 hypothetical protein XNC1_2342 [Xenorhabdus nematophila ATCC 19061]CCW32405.1 conserved hypothetical protein [Xenorhabdus nematophila F1]CEE95469.1 hypothetical protein XNA1_5170009 [Xenorhabdus nematophila str. Anatoliense]CEK23254.1 hypothetical protein XNC2_2260 [Xenorhabdus nematophila AN6/1]
MWVEIKSGQETEHNINIRPMSELEKEYAMLFVSRQLHYFITTAQTLCITKAASRLYITPSPLGRSIAQLEAQLGYPLFVRQPDGLVLTPQGKNLYQEVYPYYQKMIQLEKGLNSDTEQFWDKFKIASDGLYTGFCTTLADKLSALVPPQYLQMQTLPVTTMSDVLRSNTVDICLVSDRLSDERGLYGKRLLDEPLKLAVSTELATEDPNAIAALMKEFPLAQYHIIPDSELSPRVRSYFYSLGISPRILRFSEMSQRLQLVTQGLAVSLVAASVARLFACNGLRLLDLPADAPILTRYAYCLAGRCRELSVHWELLESSLQLWQEIPDEAPILAINI